MRKMTIAFVLVAALCIASSATKTTRELNAAWQFQTNLVLVDAGVKSTKPFQATYKSIASKKTDGNRNE